MRAFLRSKIHKATVTEANLDYIGSITIDEALLEKADIAEYEQVLVVNNTNGNRLETYALKGPRNSGVICMNGAAAHLVKRGDEVIIMTFELSQQAIEPIAILVNPHNQFVQYLTLKSDLNSPGRSGHSAHHSAHHAAHHSPPIDPSDAYSPATN
jgi:aspartate 1-decarboxylase